MNETSSSQNGVIRMGNSRNILFLSAFTLLCLYLIRRIWKNRRYWELGSKMPGPPTIPIFGNIFMFVGCNLVDCFHRFVNLQKQYGPILRLWGGFKLVVFIADPESIEKTFANRKFENRGAYAYKVAKPIFNNGIILSRGNLWKSHRKVISATFQIDILEEFISTFAKNSNILADQILEKADGSTFNIYPYVFLCSLDVILETTTGICINSQTDKDNPYGKFMLRCLEILTERFRCPWLLVDWINNLTSVGREMNQIMGEVNQKFNDGIEEMMEKAKQEQKLDLQDRESLRKKKVCFADLVIQGGMMSKDEIRDEMATLTGAGSETSSTTVCYVLSLLGIHQDIQEKVLEEQRLIFYDDIHRLPTKDDIKSMVYLEKVVKETLRILPPVPFSFRSIDKETDIGHGYKLPAGTFCILNKFHLHRDPKHFPDPERFDPERFSPENSTGRHPYAYVPFGAGRRFCVGFQYAMLETKTILSTLLRRYRVTYVPGGMKSLEQRLEAGLVVKPHDGFPIQLMPRWNPPNNVHYN